MTCAITDVIADEVCNNGGISRIIFWDTKLDLSNKISTNISSFCIDTTTELGEHSDERRAKTESDQKDRDFFNRRHLV